MRHIRRLLELGWRAVAEAHTALWIIEMIGVPTALTGLLAWFFEHSPAVIAGFFVIAFAGSVLVTLAALGHWRDIHHFRAPPTATADLEWSIAELFFHISPELGRDRKNVPLREQTGASVLDALASGEIRMRGRLIIGSRRLPLRWIDEAFWRTAKFTFWFLDEGDNQSLQASSDKPYAHYTDLRVNRTAALKIWPEPIPLREAARIAYERTRGTPIGLVAERFGDTPEGILAYFEGALFLSHRVIAQKSPSTVYEEIPGYLRQQLKIFAKGQGFGYHNSKEPTYIDPRIHLADLEAYILAATEPERPGWPLTDPVPGREH